MQSICGRSKLLQRNAINFVSASTRVCSSETNDLPLFSRLLPFHFQEKKSLYSLLNSKIPFSYCCGYFLDNFQTKNYGSIRALPPSCKSTGISSTASSYRESRPVLLSGAHLMQRFTTRHVNTLDDLTKSDPEDASASATEVAPRIKFKRLDKTARHIMQILDKEAVEEVRTQREIPDIRTGYIIQLRLEVPENKRRVSTVKGIVIARRNAGLNSTIRLRRLVAGVGVESLLPLYSPNIKEIKVLDKKKVRRAKLYYLRDKMNALKK